MGCEAVATGHYARRGTRSRPRDGRCSGRARIPAKDQSYFLYDLTPEQLAAARFPVGELTKAKCAPTPGARPADGGQGREPGDLLRAARGARRAVRGPPRRGARPGRCRRCPASSRTSRGERLGEHEGHFRFTVGQRRGLGVAAAERLYVLSIDPAANRVVVGPRGSSTRARRRSRICASSRELATRPFARRRPRAAPRAGSPRDGLSRGGRHRPRRLRRAGARGRARPVLRLLRRRRRPRRGSCIDESM